jgi:hypothetical protein
MLQNLGGMLVAEDFRHRATKKSSVWKLPAAQIFFVRHPEAEILSALNSVDRDYRLVPAGVF